MKVQPLPYSGISQILGLCEALDDRGGREDIYRLAHDLQIEFGDLLLTIKAGETLQLIETPGADVALLPLGKKVIEIDMNEKKAILRQQIKGLSLFQYFIEYIKRQPEGEATEEMIKEEIGTILPSENLDQTFKTLLNWGRYGEIFSFSQDTDSFMLDPEFTGEEPPATE